MGENSAIGWTHNSFNGHLGCSKRHTGCEHCFAEEAIANRYKRVVWGPLPHGTRSRTTDEYWNKPYLWNRKAIKLGERHRVFAYPDADVFEEWKGRILNAKNMVGYLELDHLDDAKYRPVGKPPTYPYQWLAPTTDWKLPRLTMDHLRTDLYRIIDATTDGLDWLLLTKRPENIRSMTPRVTLDCTTYCRRGDGIACPEDSCDIKDYIVPGRRMNVWYGVSISDQLTADEYLTLHLNNVGLGRLLFVSIEPILGPVNIERYLGPGKIEWVIVGGESGDHRRPSKIEWYWDLYQQCRRAGVPIYIKQDTALDAGEQGRIPDELWSVKEFPPVLS